MAKQAGPHFISGTIGNMVYYQRNGRFFARTKGGVSKETFLKEPSFELPRNYSDWYGNAGKILTVYYAPLPRALRDQNAIWYPLRLLVRNWLREGWTEDHAKEEIKVVFLARLIQVWGEAPVREELKGRQLAILLGGEQGLTSLIWDQAIARAQTLEVKVKKVKPKPRNQEPFTDINKPPRGVKVIAQEVEKEGQEEHSVPSREPSRIDVQQILEQMAALNALVKQVIAEQEQPIAILAARRKKGKSLVKLD
jgi:hypothetical protein